MTTCVSPAQMRAAYNITGMGRNTTTVAIVDAYAYPHAASDLAQFRSDAGLPPCTTASGCLRIVNENGGSTVTAPVNDSWAPEQSLDLSAVSLMCPNCKILLVQANSNSFSDLGTSVNTAASLGAHAISNSYGTGYPPGGNGELGTQSFEWYYNHPGIAVTVSTGDGAYGVAFPASSPHVTAVGGTSLYMSGLSRSSESAWVGGGSGCSTAYQAPAWQTPSHANMATNTLCTMRVVADVSADADPYTGLMIFITFSTQTTGQYYQYGGTSLSSPLIAGIYGERDDTVFYGRNPYVAPPGSFFDIQTGNNSIIAGCSGTYFCTAGPGYDAPTGLGTPNGDSAF